MDERIAQIAMELIFHAGNAKSNAMLAITNAENSDFKVAKDLITEGESSLSDAHKIQTKLMQDEINDGIVEKSILLIHAQDHFMSAMDTLDLAKKFVTLYEKIETKI